MIVTIPVSDRPGFEKACAMIDQKVSFFTQEKNGKLLTMEIEDISAELAFNIARMAETQNEIIRFVNK